MKAYFQIVLLLALAKPTFTLAQTSQSRFEHLALDTAMFSEPVLFKNDSDSAHISASRQNQSFPFNYQLGRKRYNTFSDSKTLKVAGIEYAYMMPVLKPGKSSLILIAKVDPEFPYTYKMPVSKWRFFRSEIFLCEVLQGF